MVAAHSLRIFFLLPAILFLMLAGCATKRSEPRVASNTISEPGVGRMSVSSSAFADQKPIPPQFSAAGRNVSPPLEWEAVPRAQEYVVIVEDPDAPTPEPFVHWIGYRIPGGATSLPAGAGSLALVGQGTNSLGETGYTGPNPPSGKPHRYFFQVFALSAPSGLEEGASKDDVLRAMAGKVLAKGQIVGTYGRSR